MQYLELVGWLTIVSSLCVQFIGIQICVRIINKGSPGDISCMPFIIMFTSSCIWLKYGFLTGLSVVIITNVTSVALQFGYIIVYYVFTPQRKTLYLQMLIGSIIIFTVLSVAKYYEESPGSHVVNHLGKVGSIMSIISYGAPLSTFGDVIRSKSTSSMSLPLVMANFFVGMQWVYYGYLQNNIYIMYPNLLGLTLTLLQLFLFLIYPSRRQS